MQVHQKQNQNIFSPDAQSQSQGTVEMTKMIAENIFRDLKSYGLQDKDIVAVSSELLSKLTSDIRARQSQAIKHGTF